MPPLERLPEPAPDQKVLPPSSILDRNPVSTHVPPNFHHHRAAADEEDEFPTSRQPIINWRAPRLDKGREETLSGNAVHTSISASNNSLLRLLTPPSSTSQVRIPQPKLPSVLLLNLTRASTPPNPRNLDFAVMSQRDVIIGHHPLFDFSKSTREQTLRPLATKFQAEDVVPGTTLMAPTSRRPGQLSVASDWLELFTEMCSCRPAKRNRRTKSSKNKKTDTKTTAKNRSREQTWALRRKESMSSTDSSNSIKADNDDDDDEEEDDEKTNNDASMEIEVKEDLPTPLRKVAVATQRVVYPIARYPGAKLNSPHLVERRRLSLRKHLMFQPVGTDREGK